MISVDDILFDNLTSWIADIKSDPSLIDQIFLGKSVEKIEQVKQFITNNTIRTVYHHPRDNSDLPCYAIVLDTVSESDQVIGSSGDEYDEVLLSSMEDGWIGSDSNLLRPDTELRFPVTIKQFYSALQVKEGRRSCHIIADEECGIGKGIFIDFENSVLEGGYVSLVGMNYVLVYVKSSRIGTFLQLGFGVAAHGEHVYPVPITSKAAWQRVKIDIRGLADRDKDRIRYMSFTITDDSERTELFLDGLSAQESVLNVLEETFLDSAYRIESWSNNAELTHIMYQIVLWNILKYRTYLEKSWGLFRQRVDGGDIMPQPEFYPEFVYVRGLTYHSTMIETVPRESGLVAVDVKVGKTDFGQ